MNNSFDSKFNIVDVFSSKFAKKNDSEPEKCLYDLVKKYADDNYIYPLESDFVKCYFIKYEDILYEVGNALEKHFYIKVCDNKGFDFIDFNDFINDKKLERTNDIENKIAKITFLIDTLYGNGVPIKDIRSIIGKNIDKIEKSHNCKKKIKDKKDN